MVTLRATSVGARLLLLVAAIALGGIPKVDAKPEPNPETPAVKGHSQDLQIKLPDAAALKKLKAAAGAGDPKAQYELAYVYVWGEVEDFKSFEHWLRRSAEAGYVPAQAAIGRGLGLGDGVTGSLPHDPVEGLMWLIVASKQNTQDKSRYEIDVHMLRRTMKPHEIKTAELRAQAYKPKRSR